MNNEVVLCRWEYSRYKHHLIWLLYDSTGEHLLATEATTDDAFMCICFNGQVLVLGDGGLVEPIIG